MKSSNKFYERLQRDYLVNTALEDTDIVGALGNILADLKW
jgi:hypothetical protein